MCYGLTFSNNAGHFVLVKIMLPRGLQFEGVKDMIRMMRMASLLALAAVPAVAGAQPIPVQTISGTRLDVVATGEANRVPDVAIISAGVITRASTASQALQQNARQMERVVAALRRAGVAERDIQTSSLNLHPDYRHVENQQPVVTGYNASNQVSVRFRDIAQSGKILDALVAEGANQINGPHLTIDKPEAALDEARRNAIGVATARAQLYAQATGKRVGRILAISEGLGGGYPRPEIMVTGARLRRGESGGADTSVIPGEQTLSATIQVTFELE
jgi:hypothetical protein